MSKEIKNSDEILNLTERLNQHIKDIVEKEGYATYNIEKRKLESGYTGIAIAIDVKGKTRDGDKEINIFAKQIKTVEVPIYDVRNLYLRETFVYTDLFREMYDLQEKAKVPTAERFKISKVYDQSDDEAVILENLVVKGFKTYPRLDIVNLKYAELVIKNLARFHGLTLALKVKRPEYFEKKIKTMDCVYKFNDFFHNFSQQMRESVMQCLTNDVRERVAPQLKKLVDKYPSYMNDDSCEIKTVCHGDYRHSNIMVKEIDNNPIEIIAVDYQITYYGNPITDFVYFMMWGTDQEFRKKHLEYLKQLYYQYMGTFLGYFGVELESVFPKKIFEKQYKERLDFGLMVASFYLPHLFPPEDDVSEGDFSKAKELSIVGSKYIERFRGIVDDYINWGYL